MKPTPDGTPHSTRRRFLHAGLIVGVSALAGSGVFGSEERKQPDQQGEQEEERVSPAEDLMREHGVLKRVLLIYGEGLRRIEGNQDLPPQALADSAKIIRGFIEDYHEK